MTSVFYSSVTHLARICGGVNWEKVKMAAFTACFDASGSESDQPCLAVAGFMATAELWIDFEENWLRRLRQDGLTYFRTSDFNSFTKEFAKEWKGNDKRRSDLITDLVQIIRSSVNMKFGFVVANKDIQAGMSEVARKAWHIRSYSLAGRTCAARIREWAQSWHARSLPEMVFEKGDPGRYELEKLFEQSQLPAPIFKPKKDIVDRKTGLVEKAFVPLQAADLLAYELFDPVRKIENDGYIKKIKKTIEELDRILGPIGKINLEHVKLLDDALTQFEEIRISAL
jgi:hypothetical protein